MTVKLLIVLVWAIAAVAAEAKPSTVGSHVWGSAALARCSSPYQREVLADPQGRSGQAVRFTGEAGFISMHDEVGIAPGRSRFTVRLRLERGGHFATDFEAGGRGFQSRAPIEFADLPADGSFAERVVELNLPGPLNVVSLRGGLPNELIVDRITVEPVADASPVEVASVRVANFSIHQPYSADEADANVAAFRRNFVTVTEIDFWAPCDMSQLVPPPGKDRWWSGQTAQRFSTEQLRTCIAKAHAQGIRVLGYADYSVIFGFRGYDFGRRFPDCLDWRTQNDNGFVWLGFDAKNMGLDSDLRAEDDTRQDVKVTGVSRSLHTNPNAFRWHADQMVASMKHFGWDGFRYDDPIDYDARQVDLQGREAPFNGYGLGEITAYSRRRIEEVKPGALLGHNGDPMRASSDAMYVSDDPERMDKQETAVSRDLAYVAELMKRYNTESRILQTLELAESHGMNAINPSIWDNVSFLQKHWQNGGRMKLIAQALPSPDLDQFKKAVDRLQGDGGGRHITQACVSVCF